MWGCWLAVSAGVSPHRGGCSTGWWPVLGQGMGQRVGQLPQRKSCAAKQRKGRRENAPSLFANMRENPYGKWRDHPLFEQTTMYICDLSLKNSFPNRKAVFVSALEKPDIIDFPVFAAFLPQPPDRTRRKNLGQKRCEKCVQQKGNRIACFAKYPEASMRCAVFAEMDWEAKQTGLPVATPLPGGQQALTSLESEQTTSSLVVLYIQVIDPDVARHWGLFMSTVPLPMVISSEGAADGIHCSE